MSLVFHSAAAKKVKEIMGDDPDVTEDTSLRVFIEGGGCSGFQYGFTFDEKANPGDLEIVKNGVTLVIDPMSMYPIFS